MENDKVTKTTLAGGALAAIAASVCCLGPLILVSLGVGGAWVSNLTLLEPFRPIFIVIALLFMVVAYRKIYHVPQEKACAPGTMCALPQANTAYRLLFWGTSFLVLVALVYPYLAPLLY
jgi:mercuric ion transport protein